MAHVLVCMQLTTWGNSIDTSLPTVISAMTRLMASRWTLSLGEHSSSLISRSSPFFVDDEKNLESLPFFPFLARLLIARILRSPYAVSVRREGGACLGSHSRTFPSPPHTRTHTRCWNTTFACYLIPIGLNMKISLPPVSSSHTTPLHTYVYNVRYALGF